jgi:hypothetical protein
MGIRFALRQIERLREAPLPDRVQSVIIGPKEFASTVHTPLNEVGPT